MKQEHEAVQEIKTWLESSNGYEYVQQMIAVSVRKYLTDGAVPLYLSSQFSSDPLELQAELAHEYLLFLLQSFLPEFHRYPDLINNILTGRISLVLRIAVQRFFWKLQDIGRKKDINPRAYLYRRMRETISGGNFTVQKNERNIPAYAPAGCDDELSSDWSVFTHVHYLDWPPPPGKKEEKKRGSNAVYTSAFLADAALFFWHESVRRLRAKYMIPIREPIQWLAVHYPWLNRLQSVSLSEIESVQERGTINRQAAEDHLDQLRGIASITALADQFAQGMEDYAKDIFLSRLAEPPVSFKEIALRLALKDHNRAYSIHRKTIRAMQDFTSSWPGPPLHELPEEVGLAFIESVRKICEKKQKNCC